VTRGTARDAIAMHPPWIPGGGTLFADYRVQVPDAKPIRLLFANAIRDNRETEPASDGVTFRVWAGQDKLYERHTDSKTWVDGQADLSPYAGEEILLRLESHPGPDRNTACDGSFWAEPTIIAGDPPRQLTERDREALRQRARTAVKRRRAAAADELVFPLGSDGDPCIAAVVPGPNGIFDAAIALGRGDRCVVFDGLQLSILDQPVGRWPSPVVIEETTRTALESGGVRLDYALRFAKDKAALRIVVRPEGQGLRIQARCPTRITDIAVGPADQRAPRVYYGHGYCIVEPEAFRAGFGGHNLATSHVGFDFASGVSLLQASDSPPDYLQVDPEARLYALHSHMDTTLTLVPSLDGALDAAVRYRPLFNKHAAPGVERKAGRFVFDIWGGRYADIAETMREMVDYGLTDSLLTVHVWQRWGYDYRLPDIWPPNPDLGTVEDMRKIAAVCKVHDIPWGLHDNYIDFYPDATDYTYDRICFTPDGQPIRAWINYGRDAQSYRWRPDCIMPFVQRNLRLIKPGVAPTHYFIDVFTSARCFDYYDRQGHFHPSTETRRCWGEAFAWIRDTLGGDAPTTSEAGHDQLIGYLDGADCQHLQLSTKRERFHIDLPCQDWERVPWFDVVNHARFSLHGVGYSGRYQGGRSRRYHGITSDDYLSAEMLFGHALMMDRGGFGPPAVRKYWLAQDFIRSIAQDAITKVEFADGDIHRQVVTWESGAQVRVNRGAEDWEVAGKVLPQYGYYAKNGDIESSVERINGVIVEHSRASKRLYVNARTHDPDPRLRITPTAQKVEHWGENRVRLLVDWRVEEPAPTDLAVFLHFDHKAADARGDRIFFQADLGRQPTSDWQGTVTTRHTVAIPENAPRGAYKIRVGLWDPTDHRRYPLLGDDDGQTRIRLGKLVVKGAEGEVADVQLIRHEHAPTPQPRTNTADKPVAFGPVTTDGACRIFLAENALTVLPLPETPAFTLSINTSTLGLPRRKPKEATARDRSGKALRRVEVEFDEHTLRLKTQAGDFQYRIRF
jgi:hypothetical protein